MIIRFFLMQFLFPW